MGCRAPNRARPTLHGPPTPRKPRRSSPPSAAARRPVLPPVRPASIRKGPTGKHPGGQNIVSRRHRRVQPNWHRATIGSRAHQHADEFPGESLAPEPSFEEIAAARPVPPPAAPLAAVPPAATSPVAGLNAADPAAVDSNAGEPTAGEPNAVDPARKPDVAGAAYAVAGGFQPSHYWTWRLLTDGYSPADCAAIRGMAADVVLDHALRAIDNGWAVEVGWLLPSDLVSRLEKLIGDREPERIRPLLAKLPRGTRYEEVQLFLKCRFPPPTGRCDYSRRSGRRLMGRGGQPRPVRRFRVRVLREAHRDVRLLCFGRGTGTRERSSGSCRVFHKSCTGLWPAPQKLIHVI